MSKGKPENSFTVAKNQEFELITSCHLKKKKKRFLRKSSESGHGNLVLITWTVQVERSKSKFDSDDIGTYSLQVLRDSPQITFVTLNGFCPLSKRQKQKIPPLCS